MGPLGNSQGIGPWGPGVRATDPLDLPGPVTVGSRQWILWRHPRPWGPRIRAMDPLTTSQGLGPWGLDPGKILASEPMVSVGQDRAGPGWTDGIS